MTVVASAVHHAHSKGVIHRDLKPSNILIDINGNPFVSDFGLAKQDAGEVTMTVTGVILGTPAYMSPEQARGFSNKCDARSDVYSLGVILYEMLTGELPFKGSSRMLLHQIQSEDPRTPRSIEKKTPRDLETICLKALEKRPDRRYQTAEELEQDLRRFLAGDPVKARRISFVERLARKVRRNRFASISLAVATVAVCAAIGVFLYFSGQAPRKKLTVTINTKPEGASVVFYRRDDYTGEPISEEAVRPKGKTPITTTLDYGDYLVVAVLDDGRFHEVYRHVPEDPWGTPDWYPHRKWTGISDAEVSLPPIRIPKSEVIDGMALFDGARDFPIGIAGDLELPLHQRDVASFYMDTHEFTYGMMLTQMKGTVSPYLAKQKEFAFANPNHPITGLGYNEAVMFAEAAGKRLPTEFEFEFASRLRPEWKYPSGDALPKGIQFDDLWQVKSVLDPTHDKTSTHPPVTGLFSNAAEFTSSRFLPYDPQFRPDMSETGFAVSVRGGPAFDEYDKARLQQVTTRGRTPIPSKSPSKRVGFRCVRSKSPRLKAEDFRLNQNLKP